VRALLLSLLLLFGAAPAVAQQEERPETSGSVGQGQQERHAATASAALVPAPRPEIVAGELRTARFRILHTDRSRGVAEHLARRLEDARAEFAAVLGRDWPGEMEVRVGLGREELEKLALPGANVPTWAEALAYPAHGILLLNGTSLVSPEGESVLRHELAHVALGRLAPSWPRWFQEGFAMHVSGERTSLSRYTALFRAVRNNRVFPLADLTHDWPDRPSDVEIAYAQSEAFFAFLLDRHGTAGFSRLLDARAAGEPFKEAFATAMKTTLADEEHHFREQLPQRFSWLPLTVTTSLMWLGAAALCVAAFLRVRAVKRRRLDEMAAEEAAEEAARRVLEAEAAALDAPPDDPTASASAAGFSEGEPAPEEEELTPAPEPRAPTKPTLH
jgi:hypothetical protein